MACSQCKTGPAARERGTVLIDYVLMVLCISILAIVAVSYSGSSTAAEYAKAGDWLHDVAATATDHGADPNDDVAAASGNFNGDGPGNHGPANGGWSDMPGGSNNINLGNSGG